MFKKRDTLDYLSYVMVAMIFDNTITNSDELFIVALLLSIFLANLVKFFNYIANKD